MKYEKQVENAILIIYFFSGVVTGLAIGALL
jgi:hypothetical protein